MSGKALIVEDEAGVGALLSEVCTGLGLTVELVRGGSDAIQSLKGALPTIVLSDLSLADLDGFQVAEALRQRPGGERVPLLFVSGIYKKLPDGVAEKVRAAFLPKPFDVATLRETLSRMLGAGDGSALMRGRFDTRAPSALFAELSEKRSTGVLDVSARELKRRVWFQSGSIRFGQSNVKAESAGGLLLADGTISDAQFDAAVTHARARQVPLHDALVATGAVTVEQAQGAVQQQAHEVVLGVLGMAGADWSFSAADVDKLPDARLHPLVAIVAHAQRTLSAADAREALEARGDVRVGRSVLLDRELYALRQAFPGETVTSHAGKVTLAEQLRRTREDDLPMLWALVQAGLLQLSDRDVDTRSGESVRGAAPQAPVPTGVMIGGGRAPVAVPEVARPVDPDKGKKFTPEERATRSMLKAEHERFKDATHYEVLGVSPKAGPDEIKRGFLEAARKFHADGYSGQDLGSAQSLLAALFSRVNEANEVLSDAKRREEYDIYVDRKSKGLPTDVAVILQAEEIFQRGEKLAKANRWNDALPLFRQAVELNPGEAEFHAFLGYATYRIEGPTSLELARRSIDKALAESDKLPNARYFLGMIAKESGDEATAEKEFRAALELDKRHEPATLALRDLRRSQEKRAGGGWMKKLFGG